MFPFHTVSSDLTCQALTFYEPTGSVFSSVWCACRVEERRGLALWVSDLVESITWQCQDREAEMQFVEIISPAVTIFTNAHNFPFTFLQAKKKKKSASLHRCTPISCAPVLPEPPYLSSKETTKRSISTQADFSVVTIIPSLISLMYF